MATSFFKNPLPYKKIIESKKGATIIFIIGLVGIALICLSSLLTNNKNTNSSKTESTVFDMDSYTQQLENRLKSLVDEINGTEGSTVLVTIESGPEYIYAKKEKQSADTSESSKTDGYQKSTADEGENEYIIIETKDGEEALLVTELAPKVKGVAVVCKNGNNSTVAERIKSAIATALNISANKISVTGIN